MNVILRDYKTHGGAVNFPAVLSIPNAHRLPVMAKTDYNETLGVVTAGVAMAIESMNLARPMSSLQVVDLSEAILDTATEDNLSLEDLILFMQGLIRGNYGALYESMDIPKFMEKFEQYREQRHQSLMVIREEQQAQHRALPVNERIVDMFPDTERTLHREATREYMKNFKPE